MTVTTKLDKLSLDRADKTTVTKGVIKLGTLRNLSVGRGVERNTT